MTSRATSINMMCKRCIYDNAVPGSWRFQVEQCTSGPSAKDPCPLYEHRPITMETMLARRKEKSAANLDLDALVDDLDDETDEPVAVTA